MPISGPPAWLESCIPERPKSYSSGFCCSRGCSEPPISESAFCFFHLCICRSQYCDHFPTVCRGNKRANNQYCDGCAEADPFRPLSTLRAKVKKEEDPEHAERRLRNATREAATNASKLGPASRRLMRMTTGDLNLHDVEVSKQVNDPAAVIAAARYADVERPISHVIVNARAHRANCTVLPPHGDRIAVQTAYGSGVASIPRTTRTGGSGRTSNPGATHPSQRQQRHWVRPTVADLSPLSRRMRLAAWGDVCSSDDDDGHAEVAAIPMVDPGAVGPSVAAAAGRPAGSHTRVPGAVVTDADDEARPLLAQAHYAAWAPVPDWQASMRMWGDRYGRAEGVADAVLEPNPDPAPVKAIREMTMTAKMRQANAKWNT